MHQQVVFRFYFCFARKEKNIFHEVFWLCDFAEVDLYVWGFVLRSPWIELEVVWSTFLIHTNICSIWSFSENCEMQHMQMHIQTLPRCTLSTPMWTLMETSISKRNFFIDFDDTIFRKECLLLTVRMHAMNYNQMIFCAIINKIWIVRKSLAKLAVTEEFVNSLLLHSLLSINQNKTLRNDVKL